MKAFTIRPLVPTPYTQGLEGGLATVRGCDCLYYVARSPEDGWWWSVDGVVSPASSEAAALEAINHDHRERLMVAFLDEVKS